MRLCVTVGLPILLASAILTAQDRLAQTREIKQREAQSGTPEALRAWAEFLDAHKDPAARQAYAAWIAKLPASGEARATALRRLTALDLLAGDQPAAARHASEAGAALPPVAATPATPSEKDFIAIPGPLRSFSRMAALAPDIAAGDLLPALARNVVTNGYQATSGAESLDQTEYLKLVFRYLSQARELEKLAGASKRLRIPACESTETAEVLRVLGYRMRGGCGSEVVLETVNATRAFLTIDSGFPLAELEQALRANRPFEYDYRPTQVPVLFGSDYWRPAKEKPGQEFIDMFLSDPAVCRLYLGMHKLDPPTAEILRKHMTVTRVRSFAHVLDFFGGMFVIRDGKAAVPGGERTAKTWGELAGASPDQGAQFFEKLLVRDDGWLASYFDALIRARGPVQAYLTEPARLKRFYAAVRGKVTSPGPARPVFRSNTDMLLLTTRLRVSADGKVLVPGNLDVWKNLFVHHPQGKYDGKLTKAAGSWKEPDDLLEALFGLSRKAVENEPLKIFMALSDLDRRRSTPMSAEVVDRLARNYKAYGAQYALLSEAPGITDATVLQFMDAAQAVAQIRDPGLRSDAAGVMQSLAGIWQILVRQGSIPDAKADAALSTMLGSFAKVKNERDVFDGGFSGVKTLLAAAGVKPDASPQDAMLDLMAGAASSQDSETHTQVVQSMVRIFEAQRLVSLKLLFDLMANFEGVSKGEKLNTALVGRLATRIADTQLPRSALAAPERNSYAFGYWVDKHIDAERKLNLRGAIEKAGNDAEKLKDVRGQLAPVLRDTLVGFTYVHYAPPGAQILHTNPLFVRGHDFLGVQGGNQTWRHTEVMGSGWPSNAGGRLVGSLATLPYALAEAEQNFLIPRREQALIWGDLVPQMILTAKVPRWWTVSPDQMYWVGLHLRLSEAAVAEAAFTPALREKLLAALAQHAPPGRLHAVTKALDECAVPRAVELITPSEHYLVAGALLASGWSDAGPLAAEIRQLSNSAGPRVSADAISRAFGTPKPTLTNSYRPELLHLRTFPTLMGYSSRIMAESWESNLLYFAALADEIGAAPSQLNVLVPEWTQRTVEQIFATHLEDWPALLRSLRVIGDEVRGKQKRAPATAQNLQ